MAEWNENARLMIARAVLAPSSHNTQPWSFRLSETAIDLFADRARALPVNDPEDRELTISCGCALMNLRLAAAGCGIAAQVRLLPEPGEPDLLARVSLADGPQAAHGDAALADVIETRRTYRKRFAAREPSAPTLDALIDAARLEGAQLLPVVAEEARRSIADLVVAGDAAQWADPRWRRELAAWMRPRRRGDGLAMPALVAPLARLVVRGFDMGAGVGARDRRLVEASPLLAVLGTDGDHPHDWLVAGQALQRTLLVARKHGLQASYLNQPIQVAALRPQLARLAGVGFPQMLLRIGYPLGEVAAAPRRAPDAVLTGKASGG